MRGIVFNGDKAEVTQELQLRDIGPTEVKVRMVAAGVCHSDVSVINGTIPFATPVVLGHEGAGVVEEVGNAVRTVQPGDHVVLTTLNSCGKCAHCSTGHPTWCRSSIGMPTQPFSLDGQPVWNFASASVFSDMTVVSEVQAVPIDKDVPLTSACLIGCGVITGAGAVLNRARVQPGQSAAVFGIGGIGLNVIQALVLSAASRIIAVDTVASKEALARQFGATDFINAAEADAVKEIRRLLPGNGIMASGGVDWSFECVGHPAVLANAIDVLDWGGNCVIIGVPPPDAQLSTIIGRLTHIDRGVMGCRYGSAQPHHDIARYVDWYKQGRFKLDELVSATYPLEEFETVIHDMHEGKLARGVLTF